MNWRVVRNRKNRNSSPSGLNDLSDPLLGIYNRNHHAADAITMNGTLVFEEIGPHPPRGRPSSPGRGCGTFSYDFLYSGLYVLTIGGVLDALPCASLSARKVPSKSIAPMPPNTAVSKEVNVLSTV